MRSHIETMITCTLGSTKFTTQDGLDELHLGKRVASWSEISLQSISICRCEAEGVDEAAARAGGTGLQAAHLHVRLENHVPGQVFQRHDRADVAWNGSTGMKGSTSLAIASRFQKGPSSILVWIRQMLARRSMRQAHNL
jgi:hypothetical protein